MSQEIYNDIVSKVEKNLGISLDRNSYDYDILKTVSDFLTNNQDTVRSFINSYTFENLESNNLDNFLNFFDVYRSVGNNEDLYSLKLKYVSSNQNSLTILKNCTIKLENSYYKVLKDTVLNSEENILTVQKIFNIDEVKEPVYSNKGTLVLDKNYVKSSQDVILESDLPKNLYVISIIREANEKESDFEFLEKAKSILQSYGYSNEKKIELTLLKDNRIKSVYITSDGGTTNITIFPKNIEEIDEIIKYNQNVVDYYKASNIILHKPNLFEINIRNIEVQLANYGNTDTIKEIILEDLE